MSYASEVLADSPFLWWRFGEPSGTTAADSSGNGNTGTYNGGPTLGAASLLNSDTDTSVNFDAVDDYCLSAAVIGGGGTRTLEVWFDYDGTPPAGGTWSCIVCCAASDQASAFTHIITIDSGGHAVFEINDGVTKRAISATVLTAGVYHLVGRVNGTAAQIFVNGVSDGTVATSIAGDADKILCGGRVTSGGTYLRKAGRRDEVASYATALSDARILAHYNAGIASGQSPPFANVTITA